MREVINNRAPKHAKKKLRGVRCAEHDRVPRARVKRGLLEFDNLCCEKLKDEVTRAFSKD
jgi:hypothetical protein